MKFWRNQHHICRECRCHFEPWPEGVREPTDLCGTCRAPVIARADRIAVVLEWARQNWESLEPQAIQFAKERSETFITHANLMAAQPASYPGVLGALGIFG